MLFDQTTTATPIDKHTSIFSMIGNLYVQVTRKGTAGRSTYTIQYY